MSERFDAVVIGGGPAGSSVATALALGHWRVALVERASFPRRKVCGEFVSATTIPVLDRLGLGDRWRAEAGPEVRRLALFAGERIVEAPMPAVPGEVGFGRALGRDRLDLLLLDWARAAGVAVRQPVRATGFRRVADLGLVDVADGKGGASILEAPVVIAAHGSWEPGPLPSHLPKRHAPNDFLGFKAHFAGGRLAPDLMPLLQLPGGYGGMVTVEGGRLSLSLCIRQDVLENIRTPGRSAAEAVHTHLLHCNRGVRETIGDAVPDGAWLASGPIRPGLRPLADDGLLRVGNTAGESHPVVAEGISMAIQSAWLLAQALGPAPLRDRERIAEAERRYAAGYRRQFATRIRTAEIAARLSVSPLAANWAGVALARAPALLTLGARLAGKARPLAGGKPATG